MIKTIVVKYKNLKKTTKTSSLIVDIGATSTPPIGDSFMYVEKSSNNHGKNVFVSLDRSHVL